MADQSKAYVFRAIKPGAAIVKVGFKTGKVSHPGHGLIVSLCGVSEARK